jgi:hypothetical protein
MPSPRFRCLAVLILIAVGAPLLLSASSPAKTPQPQLSHAVYFSLQHDSPEARARLVAGCRKYLSGHEGTLFFAAGTRATEMVRDVNDRDWDVSLLIVFRNKAAHDVYAKHPRHMKFIAEYAKDWSKVRVFDSNLDVLQDDK